MFLERWAWLLGQEGCVVCVVLGGSGSFEEQGRWADGLVDAANGMDVWMSERVSQGHTLPHQQ